MFNPVSVSGLATGFVVSGTLLGLPSLLVLLLYAAATLRDRLAPAATSLAIGDHPDALLLMLAGIVKVVALLGRLMDTLFGLLAIAAAVGLMTGAALWLTGRGLHAQAPWARVSGSVLLMLALLPSVLLALSATGLLRWMTLLLAAGCALGLHALWSAPR